MKLIIRTIKIIELIKIIRKNRINGLRNKCIRCNELKITNKLFIWDY